MSLLNVGSMQLIMLNGVRLKTMKNHAQIV